MDLIDRGKLKEDILKWLPKDRCGEEDYGIPFEENIVVSVIMEIDEQPTVDAVSVVRCKDCKHMVFSDFYGECSKGHISIVSLDDFCSYGEHEE